MADKTKRQIEKFEADYEKVASKDVWEPCEITLMKDLQKLMYYLEVRKAMKEGGNYPGSEYMEDDDDDEMSYRSYARMRNGMGQFTSGRRSRAGGSYDRGMPGNMGGSGRYPMNGGPWYYDDGRGSGNRYYDGEKEDAVHKLHKMMDSDNNPEFKMAIQEAIRFLEAK